MNNQTFIVGINTDRAIFEEWIDEHDKQIREDVIDEVFESLVDEISETEHHIETEDGDTYGLTSNELCGCIERVKQRFSLLDEKACKDYWRVKEKRK